MIFFFNDTATTEIYTLSLHDALPIWHLTHGYKISFSGKNYVGLEYGLNPETELIDFEAIRKIALAERPKIIVAGADRKSTRLNSSHANISYAVFCLKKNKKKVV